MGDRHAARLIWPPLESVALPQEQSGRQVAGAAGAERVWGRLVGGALEVENLRRHVGVRVDARHERPDPAPGYPIHGLAKVVLADMLEEHPSLPQALVLA